MTEFQKKHDITESGLTEAVKRGVVLLDSKIKDWRSKINLTWLDMNSSDTCILGQIYGSYYAGCEALGLSRPDTDQGVIDTINYGFTIDNRVSNRPLTYIWRDACSKEKSNVA